MGSEYASRLISNYDERFWDKNILFRSAKSFITLMQKTHALLLGN